MGKKLSELKPSDEVMVELREKTENQNGKSVTVDKARKVTMTKAGYDAIEQDEDGFAVTLGRPIELLGTVKYSDEKDNLGNAIQVPAAVKFTAEKTETPLAEKAQTPPAL